MNKMMMTHVKYKLMDTLQGGGAQEKADIWSHDEAMSHNGAHWVGRNSANVNCYCFPPFFQTQDRGELCRSCPSKQHYITLRPAENSRAGQWDWWLDRTSIRAKKTEDLGCWLIANKVDSFHLTPIFVLFLLPSLKKQRQQSFCL